MYYYEHLERLRHGCSVGASRALGLPKDYIVSKIQPSLVPAPTKIGGMLGFSGIGIQSQEGFPYFGLDPPYILGLPRRVSGRFGGR